ncbi:uncharacterized protein LOC107623498 isoform X1 [Arachis ipaensis]|uniref:uncharacterized protein LOC107623498 isoform X1 n=1 Tax=Arachis ipaensis TaxID=130454 RepID=UPI000A2B744B|nr:uncharacterized protein LOC107623498 isoform X1 [Arachis ipaensis]XP_025680895.1 uncharacterized protein LOC112782632 isoform X1 [Arachis hypogaea]
MAVLNRRFHTYIKEKTTTLASSLNETLRRSQSRFSLSFVSSDNAVLPSRLLLSPPVTISLAPRSGLVLKHSIDVGAGVIDTDRVLCSTSLRSQILDLGSSFLASAIDTACKAGEVYLFISLMSLKTIYWKIHLRGIPFFYSPNSTLHLYGGAAFERVIYEFRCAAYSIECPPVSREKVANILLAHAGRGGARGITEAAAKIARFAARSWLAPLFDTVCDRLGFVLGNLFDLALERNRSNDSEYGSKTANMDDCVGFHAALRCAYSRFIKDLSKQCKQLIRHHLDSVTSPFLQLDVLLVFLDV